MKKMIGQLRESLSANFEKRSQHKSDPEKFLESEAELHLVLKRLQSVSAYPQYV